MIHSIHFWLRCCLLLAGFFALLSSATIVAEREGLTREFTDMVRNRAINLGVLALGFVLGMVTLDAQRLSHVQKLKDVLVVSKHDDANFTLRYKGVDFQATICSDSIVDWAEGEMLKEWDYEQRKGCKTLHGSNLGFLAYTDKYGNRLKFSVDYINQVQGGAQ